MGSAWRLGEELWRGPWHQASGQVVPWRGRRGYGALCLGPAGPSLSPTLLVLGGLDEEAGPLNDVWRSDDEGQTWELSSPHDAGRRDGGNLILRKWIGRSAFATAASWSHKGGRLSALLYVIGGNGPKRPLADVWVSEDLGRNFVRMCGEAPFGARSDASLAVCPGTPDRLILSGGMAGLDTYKKAAGAVRPLDCWISLDAGEHWTEVSAPEVPLRTAPKLHFAGAESLLLLGGSSISMVGQALVVARQLAPDAFAARVDWEGRCLSWRPAEVLDAGGGPLSGRPLLRSDLVAGALRSWHLVACGADAMLEGPRGARVAAMRGSGGQDRGSADASAAAEAPEGARLALVEPLTREMGEWQHLLLPAGGLGLLLLSDRAAWTTRQLRATAGEQRAALGPADGLLQQLSFMEWLGARFEERGLPREVWSRVVASAFHPRALALPGLPGRRFQCQEALERVRRELGDAVRICVLGPPDARDASRALAAAVASYLDAGLDFEVAIVTRGSAGVERAFAEHCGDGSQVFNLLPVGQASGYDSGRDIQAGTDARQCLDVFTRLGDIYIVFEGEADVAEAARRAWEEGALLVPLAALRVVGPGGVGLPRRVLQRPAGVGEEAWALLRDPSALVQARAEAAMEVTAGFVLARETAAQATTRLDNWFGEALRVCILVTEEPSDEEATGEFLDLVRALAAQLDERLDRDVPFVTAGMTAAAQAFRESCTGSARYCCNLLPAYQASRGNRRPEIRAGADLAQCREVLGRLGDVYIALAGGPEASKVARQVVERGARLVPVPRMGGAAAGCFDFPEEALQRPTSVSEECWALLASQSAPVAATARAAATAVAAVVSELAAESRALREAEQRAEEEAQLAAKEEAGRRAREAAELRRREEEERRAREEKAALRITILTSKGSPCGVVQVMPDDRIARLRELAKGASPVLNGRRFVLMSHTVSLTDDITIMQAGLRNGSIVTASFL